MPRLLASTAPWADTNGGVCTGHILTRVVCKGAHALGILKEYKEELLVLEALLEQKRWRRARRGRWYERSALVLMHHLKEEEGSFERAIKIIHTALYDPDTHIGMSTRPIFIF